MPRIGDADEDAVESLERCAIKRKDEDVDAMT